MSNSDLTLSGKRAVVTGGSKGIGRSVALLLAAAGAEVAITARHRPDLAAVAAEISALGRPSLVLSCDVTDRHQIQQMTGQLLAEFGGVDILVNNAGNAQSHKFLNHPDALWDQMLAVNLTSAYLISKALLPAMVAQNWGRIINMASIAAKIGDRYLAAYAAAKHGLLGLTRSLAMEFISYDITVNAICPGYVDTPLTAASVANIAQKTGMSQDKAREILRNVSPQKRLIQPDEVAAVALLLAQPQSRGITGQAINVDGGTVMA
jgi:3-hydroxybutyrate dehydrogenase